MTVNRQLLVELECLAREYASIAFPWARTREGDIRNVLDMADVIDSGGVPAELAQLAARAAKVAQAEPASFGWGIAFGSLIAAETQRLREQG